jgi:AraC-like DNA-binding protein
VYRLSTPHPSLHPFIEHYWHVFATPERQFELTVDVFVDLRADLILNVGAPYHRTALHGTRQELRHSNLDAQRLYPIRIEQRGAMVVSGARFRMGGLMPFVTTPLHEWNDRTLNLDDAFGMDARALEHTVRMSGPEIGPQTAALDDFFRSRLTFTDAMALTLQLARAIEGSGGLRRIEELSAHAGASQRQIDRLFRRHIGVGPKTFARVTRFQRSLHRLKTHPGVSLGTVAADGGYADHPHFVREFKRFAGVPPSHKLGYFPPGAPNDFSPNLVQFVQDSVAT